MTDFEKAVIILLGNLVDTLRESDNRLDHIQSHLGQIFWALNEIQKKS